MPQTIDFDKLHHIAPGQHLYQFYKGRDDYLKIMLAYFQAGLEKGEACIWLLSRKMEIEKTLELCRKEIKRFSFYLETGQLTVRSAEEWYLKDTKFDEDHALRNISEFTEEKRRSGFTKFRGAGDAGAIPQQEWNKLHSYEEKITEMIRGSSFIALCAYPILDCSISNTRSVIETHDGVLVGHW